MPAKIRLQRHGKKGRPFYHIVVADARAPRDGKFIEKLGTYNPNTNPATIELNVDKAVAWINNGAQPTDTTRAILSYKGVLYKNHLAVGVKKGALTQEQADAKFAAWLSQKETKIGNKVTSLASKKDEANKAKLVAETKAASDKAAAIAAKNTPVVEEEAPVAEETSAETEAPATDAPEATPEA